VSQPDDPEDADPGLARQRTRLAWNRTAIAFAAVGGATVRVNVPAGVTVLAAAPLIWLAGRHLSRHLHSGRARPGVLLLTTVAVTAVALAVLLAVLFGHGSPHGFHPPSQVRGGLSSERAARLPAPVGNRDRLRAWPR
jgi:uncharacterized membrane protein YidH (DUF202 family)